MENNSNNNSSNQNRSWEDNSYSNQGFDSTNSGQQQHQGQQQNWSSQPYRSKLPADPSSLVLAIIATVFLVLCCCFLGYYPALVLSVIGFFIAQGSINKYRQNADQYDPRSYKKVNNAKIFNLVVGIVSLLLVIMSFFSIFNSVMNEYNYIDMMNGDDNEWYDEDYEYEESETEDDWYEYEEEADSLSIKIESTEVQEEVETVIEEKPED